MAIQNKLTTKILELKGFFFFLLFENLLFNKTFGCVIIFLMVSWGVYEVVVLSTWIIYQNKFKQYKELYNEVKSWFIKIFNLRGLAQ